MIRNKIFFLLTIFLLLLPALNAIAQSQEEIANKLREHGITTQQDILNELSKRGMTEDDARRMAKQYGIDYDTFIKTYIMGGKQVDTTYHAISNAPVVVPVIVPPAMPESTKTQIQPQIPPVKIDTTVPRGPGGLIYFGYNVFKNMPGAFQPAEVGPVDPGYLIGPGDELMIYMWGSIQLQYDLIVDNQGNIFIPTVGQFFVSGIQYKDFKLRLTNYLSKFYEGLVKSPPSIFLDVTLAKLKPIKIFVLGEVQQPGGYNISSFATVFNALYSFGGPLTTGSLRDIRVIRNNKVLTTVDLYDYLLKGKLIGDVRLQDNDIIFIPPREKTVSVSGEVLRPAIYELKPDENLQKLIQFAGGLKSTAYTGRAQINRIIPFSERKEYQLERKLVDVDLTGIENNTSPDIPLYDEDKLEIYPILDKLENFVAVEGDVYRPGTYDLDKVPDVKSLIKQAFGVKPDVYYGKADIIRTFPDESRQFITFDLAKAIDGDKLNNITLQPRDSVQIYSIYDLVFMKTVSVSGYVKNADTLIYADSLTLYDLVFRAGGLQDPFFRGRAFLLRADIIRVNPDGLTTRIIPFDLEKLLHEKTINMDLKPGDKIYIYKGDVDKVLDKYVIIEGEVKNPGQYPLNTNMTIMDLILQAGGFTEQSLRTNAYVSRLDPGGYSGEKLSEIYTVPLSPTFLKEDSEHQDSRDTVSTNFQLQHKDIVVIRKNPNYEPQRAVLITGEVKYPGAYVLKDKRETLLDLINEAGGPTSEAFLFGASFTRDGKRLVSNLDQLYNENDKNENILLHDRDSIFIPKEPNTVSVAGQVNNPGLFKFIPGDKVKEYIDNAGGVTDSADYIVATQANGLTDQVSFGWFSGNPEIYDGASIYVTKVPPPPPQGPQGESLAITIKDIFAIVVSAVTVVVLAHQLK